MTIWSISSGQLEATISANGELRFGDLPWRVDLGPPLVQETTFGTGLRAVANFGDVSFTTAEGKTVSARSAVTEE